MIDLVKVQTLKNKAFGLDLYVGADFARDVKKSWDENKSDGVRAACFRLAETVKHTTGAWGVYSLAKNLAHL